MFNTEQIEGLPGHYDVSAEPVIDPVERQLREVAA